MGFKIVCPNDSKHNTFVVSVPVYQMWVVDNRAEYIETDDECTDTQHMPDEYDYYTCNECGAEAKVDTKQNEYIFMKGDK